MEHTSSSTSIPPSSMRGGMFAASKTDIQMQPQSASWRRVDMIRSFLACCTTSNTRFRRWVGCSSDDEDGGQHDAARTVQAVTLKSSSDSEMADRAGSPLPGRFASPGRVFPRLGLGAVASAGGRAVSAAIQRMKSCNPPDVPISALLSLF